MNNVGLSLISEHPVYQTEEGGVRHNVRYQNEKFCRDLISAPESLKKKCPGLEILSSSCNGENSAQTDPALCPACHQSHSTELTTNPLDELIVCPDLPDPDNIRGKVRFM